MSDMSDVESMERFREGIKKASDRFRQMAIFTGDGTWRKMAMGLDGLLKQGESEFKRVCPTAEVDQIINEMMKKHEPKESVH